MAAKAAIRLSKFEKYAMALVQQGGDVYDYALAAALRGVQRRAPELIAIGKAMKAPKNGAARRSKRIVAAHLLRKTMSPPRDARGGESAGRSSRLRSDAGGRGGSKAQESAPPARRRPQPRGFICVHPCSSVVPNGVA